MSKVKLSLTAISAALGLAVALQSSNVMAQQAVSADALKGTQFAGADYVRYSWGLEKVSYDAPPVKYTWADIAAQLAQANAVTAVPASADIRPVSADALKGTEFDSLEYVRHGWGLERVSFDAPSVRFSWSDVNARLATATAKAKIPAPQASAQPIPADALRGTPFDGTDFVRHSWGLEQVPYDAPSVRLNWGEIKQQLG